MKTTEIEKTVKEEKETAEKIYTIRIGESLYERLDQHILLLNHVEQTDHSKQSWILEAIQDKLKGEEGSSLIPKVKHVHFKVPKDLSRKIVNRVEFIRKFRDSYSKKKWILEAIEEKLEKEENKTKKLIEEIKARP